MPLGVEINPPVQPVVMILKENLYMKATGIVRRIEARVIITPKPNKPHKHWAFRLFLSNSICTKCQISTKFYIFGGAEKSAHFRFLRKH